MFKHDGEEAIVGIILALVAIAIVVYLIVLLATIIIGAAAAGGTIYGGGYAIKNYVASFKENVVDSNKKIAMAA